MNGTTKHHMSDKTPGEFFKRNSQLFTVLGVFAAISVYFTQLNLNSRWQRLGTVSSFTIFILVAISIQQNVTPPSSDKNPFDYIADKQLQRRGLTVFYIAFYAVIISISAIVIQYSDTLFFLLTFLFFIAGVRTATWFISLIELPEDDDILVGKSPEFPYFASIILQHALYTSIIGGGGIALVYTRGWIPISYIAQFRMSSPLSGATIGFLSGLTAAGVVFVVLMTGLLMIHYRYQRMREKGTYEEIIELMKKSPWEENE